MPNIEHSTELADDERKVLIAARMRIAYLKDGGQRITHPTGLVSIQTPEQRADERVRLIKVRADAKQAVVDFDKEQE